MNSKEYFISKLGQEAIEVAQRCSKALEFGLGEIEPGQELTNAERIEYELNDLIGVIKMCVESGLIKYPDNLSAHERKRVKVEHFAEYSRLLGCLKTDS